MDNEMKQIYQSVLETVTREIAQGSEPLAVAAVLMTTSLSIYRSVLENDKEYDKMIDTISKLRYDVKSFSGKGITLQ